jgi:hypothetical protein
MTMFRTAVLAVVLLRASFGEAADIGSGFGEEALVLTPARQAGSGGIALEDPWRQGSLMEASTVVFTSGMRWLGFGHQGGVGSFLRVGGEAFMFTTPKMTRTTENPDGAYAGEGESVGVAEYGGRVTGQLSVLDKAGWRVAALGRINGLYQQLPDSRNSGLAMEVGGQAQKLLGTGRYLTAWALVGPLGRGAARGFAGQVTGGVGVLVERSSGILGGSEGFGIGGEGQWLTDGLMHGGAGAMYWFGRPNEPGFTLFIRAGMRYADRSAEEIQPRGGIGLLWRTAGEWGVQFDYAAVPSGELGMYHYGSLSLRLPPRAPRVESRLQQDSGELTIPEDVPKEDFIITFYPENEEKGRAPIQAEASTILGAALLDGEGGFIKYLIDAHAVGPGEYVVEWDGKLDLGRMADYDKPYLIRITLGNQTRYIKMIARKAGE